jgi:uracil-DNA glycosylase family 4
MYDLAGLPWRTCDTVRKVISKSKGEEQFLKFKELFIEGCEKKKTLDAESAGKVWDELSSFGCLTGDTIIYRCSSNQYSKKELTIKEAFEYQKSKNFKWRKLKVLSMQQDGRVRTNTIKNIIYTGEKEVLEIVTDKGKTIRASHNHRFLINDRWSTATQISIGDLIKVTNLKLDKKNYTTTGTGSGAHNHDASLYTIEEQIQISKLKNKYKNKCQDCRSSKNIEMHHIDGNHRNNTEENTRLLCRTCHHSSKYHPGEIFVRFKNGYSTHNEKITSIVCVGVQPTYDIEMVEEPRNFIANGFVSHNSYGFNKSHAVEYSLISYWDMYLKTHYPAEFMACALTYGADDKKEEYITESRRLGLKIMLPEAGKSMANEWITVPGEKIICSPFIEIKGVGTKSCEKILHRENHRKFFNNKAGGSKKLESKITKLLDDIKEYNSTGSLDKEEDIQQFFQFSISDNPFGKLKGIYDLLKDKLTPLEKVDFRKESKENRVMMGKLPEIKFGYRQNVLKATKGGGKDYKLETRGEAFGGGRKHDRSGGVETAGLGDNLGGVYGFFIDNVGTSNAMLVFESTLYSRKKEEIEHCSNKIMLIEAVNPRKAQNTLFCFKSAFDQELLNCEFDGIEVSLLQESGPWFVKEINKELYRCESCELRKEAKAPVAPSGGKNNVLILGEAPGKDEDRLGFGFAGKAGEDVLWRELNQHQMKRHHFHVSNVVKCFPSLTKTPTKKQADTCSSLWLKREIDSVKPVLILALGNTPLRYLTGKDSGISQLNGTTEWSREMKAWICWCIHPASVLYHEENRAEFSKGIANFVRCFNNLK